MSVLVEELVAVTAGDGAVVPRAAVWSPAPAPATAGARTRSRSSATLAANETKRFQIRYLERCRTDYARVRSRQG